MGTLIFLSGGHAASDMAFGLVLLQNGLHLQRERPVILGQPLGQVLMYGRFADPKLFCRSANRGAVFDDVHSQIAGSLLDVMLHRYHSPYSRGSYIWHQPGKYTRRPQQLTVVIFR